jgi:hypothetical protein
MTQPQRCALAVFNPHARWKALNAALDVILARNTAALGFVERRQLLCRCVVHAAGKLRVDLARDLCKIGGALRFAIAPYGPAARSLWASNSAAVPYYALVVHAGMMRTAVVTIGAFNAKVGQWPVAL